MWLEHKTPLWRRHSGDPEIEKWKRRIYSLRAQMLQWVQHVVVFATSSVLEANWKILEGKLDKVQTVDQLLRCHVEYLDACLKECMLTVEKLLTVCGAVGCLGSSYSPQTYRSRQSWSPQSAPSPCTNRNSVALSQSAWPIRRSKQHPKRWLPAGPFWRNLSRTSGIM